MSTTLFFYFILGLALTALGLAISESSSENLALSLFNTSFQAIYALGLIYTYLMGEKLKHHSVLALIVTFSLCFTVLLKSIFLNSHGSFFAPNAVDTLFYYNAAQDILDTNLTQGISNFLDDHRWYDAGTVLYAYFILNFLNNPIAVDIANLICIFLTCSLLFRWLSTLNFTRYAPLLSFAYGASPLVLGYANTHFKEPLLTLLITVFFFCWWRLSQRINVYIIAFCVLSLASITLLRPILTSIIFFSCFLPLFTKAIRSLYLGRAHKLTLTVLVVSAALAIPVLGAIDIYLYRVASVISPSSGSTVAPGLSAYLSRLSSLVSAIIGPLPSYGVHSQNPLKSIVAAGAFFYLLLSPFYLRGLWLLTVSRIPGLQPIPIFLAMQSLSIGWILRGFDPRFTIIAEPLFLVTCAAGLSIKGRNHKDGDILIALSCMSLAALACAYTIF